MSTVAVYGVSIKRMCCPIYKTTRKLEKGKKQRMEQTKHEHQMNRSPRPVIEGNFMTQKPIGRFCLDVTIASYVSDTNANECVCACLSGHNVTIYV